MKKSKKAIKGCKAAESVAEVVQHTQVQTAVYFPSTIYVIERPDFLEVVNRVSEENLEISRAKRDLNEMYPVVIVAPPLSVGAVYVTVALVAPAFVAVPINGAVGTPAVTADVEFELALTAAIELVAVTTQRIV